MDYNKLIHAATYFLSYQDRIGRAFMVNESSLKYPVADYLTSLSIPINQIKLEYPHPTLKRRQIDLIIYNRLEKNIERAFEFKLSSPTTKYDTEQKRIFNDLMRLHLLSSSCQGHTYLIIAGTETEFIQNFRSIPTSRPNGNIKELPPPQGFYTEWFNFSKNASVTFEVKNASNPLYAEIYNNFLTEYLPNDGNTLELPNTITTTCLAISALSRDFPTPYVGGIWKIE